MAEVPQTFGERLQEHIRELGPLCVGVDPSSQLLLTWERTDSVEGLEFFALAVLEAVIGVAVAIKPQVAFFERFGSRDTAFSSALSPKPATRSCSSSPTRSAATFEHQRGIRRSVVGRSLSTLRRRGHRASLSRRRRIVASVQSGASSGRGVFVLAATSNDEGRAIQQAATSDHERVEDMVLQQVADLNHREGRLGSIGVVIGATRDAPRFDLASLSGPYLVPGVGAQGAGASDVARLFGGVEEGTVLVNVSRDILSKGPERRRLNDSARRWRDNLRSAL